MNYPMKDGQIDPEFLKRVCQVGKIGSAGWSSQYIANKVLLAAQEVMQESRPEIKRGDTVTHNSKPHWGTGKVTAISASGKSADVYFERIGFARPLVTSLTKIEEAQHGEG